MKRTTEIKERRTVGYVYGGTKQQRIKEYHLLESKYDCYMRLATERKDEKIINYIKNKQSGNGVIISLGNRGRVFEWIC